MALVCDYHDSSVNDISLRADIRRGYEQFKVRGRLTIGSRATLIVLGIAYAWFIHEYPLSAGTARIRAATRKIFYPVGMVLGSGV